MKLAKLVDEVETAASQKMKNDTEKKFKEAYEKILEPSQDSRPQKPEYHELEMGLRNVTLPDPQVPRNQRGKLEEVQETRELWEFFQNFAYENIGVRFHGGMALTDRRQLSS